jgi:prepilin-type N-terminal cleavage/methylation domain-containing protein
MRRGLTLVEVLVSLVILAFVLGAIFTILNLQTVKATQAQRTAVLQTDAQVALTLLKWDLLCAGLAYPKILKAVTSGNAAAYGGSDFISLRAAGLGFELGGLKHSWLAHDTAQIINVDSATLRAWADTAMNFAAGDTVVIIDEERVVLDPPGELVVESVQLDTFYDIWGNPMLAQQVGFDRPFRTVPGYILVRKYGECFDDTATGITIQRAVNNKLVRGGDTLLDNVEDLQFAYGVDTDGNGVIDTWTHDMPDWRGQKWAIRYTLVVASRPIGGYQYPTDSVTVEDHIYGLTLEQKKRRRAILSGVIMPPNLQP